MNDRPAFFRTLLHTFYDFEFYREVIPGGPRAAVGYLVKLALLAAALAVIILTVYQQHYFRTVVQPEIDAKVKPAFKDSPALSWQEGVLKAEGVVPFKASAEVLQQRFTMAVDTRDKPDTSPLREEAGLTFVLTAKHAFSASDKKDTKQAAYGKQYDGLSLAAGEAYRFFREFREPQFDFLTSAWGVVVVGFQLLLVLCAGSVIVGALGLLAVPEGRQFGIGGVCSVAAHAMTPATVVLLGVATALLFTARDLAAIPLWPLWAAPLTVAVLFTYLALRTCTTDASRPTRRKAETRDQDLLPPDSV